MDSQIIAALITVAVTVTLAYGAFAMTYGKKQGMLEQRIVNVEKTVFPSLPEMRERMAKMDTNFEHIMQDIAEIKLTLAKIANK